MTLHELVAAGAQCFGHKLFTLDELHGEVRTDLPDCQIVMHEHFHDGPEHTFVIDADYDAFDDWYQVNCDSMQ